MYHLTSLHTLLYINLGTTSVELSNRAITTALQTCLSQSNIFRTKHNKQIVIRQAIQIHEIAKKSK